MKRRILAMILGLAMVFSMAACGGNNSEETIKPGEPVAETTAAEEAETTAPVDSQETTADVTEEPIPGHIRIGSLKGPTSMGLVQLMDRAALDATTNTYAFTMAAAADEINTALIKGELDIVLIPANVASVLYNKTGGEVVVLNINTLGVLYILEYGETIQSVKDLAGRTIYLPGKGTTPDYAIQYLLSQNGLTTEDVDLQYKSEGTEVIAALAQDKEAIGLLPQPAATAATVQNEGLRIALDLTAEWDKVSENGGLLTGVTLVRKAFLQENPGAVQLFLEDHLASTNYTNENVAEAAQMVADLGIVPKAPIAVKAIPYCNIVSITGTEMKEALSGYLSVLADQNSKAIGGALPGDDFYYIP